MNIRGLGRNKEEGLLQIIEQEIGSTLPLVYQGVYTYKLTRAISLTTFNNYETTIYMKYEHLPIKSPFTK